MSEFFVSLSSIEDVRQFVNAATCCPCEVDVLSGRYVIDAKSIMGLFSLDLSHPALGRPPFSTVYKPAASVVE